MLTASTLVLPRPQVLSTEFRFVFCVGRFCLRGSTKLAVEIRALSFLFLLLLFFLFSLLPQLHSSITEESHVLTADSNTEQNRMDPGLRTHRTPPCPEQLTHFSRCDQGRLHGGSGLELRLEREAEIPAQGREAADRGPGRRSKVREGAEGGGRGGIGVNSSQGQKKNSLPLSAQTEAAGEAGHCFSFLPEGRVGGVKDEQLEEGGGGTIPQPQTARGGDRCVRAALCPRGWSTAGPRGATAPESHTATRSPASRRQGGPGRLAPPSCVA